MLNIAAVNRQLQEQDAALRASFARIATTPGLDPSTSALIEVVAEGLAAIHGRQATLIALMLQTSA